MLNVKKMLTKIANSLGCEYADATPSSSIYRGHCKCIKDNASNTVRVHFYFNSNSNVSTSTTLFTIPTGYRPTEETNGSMFYSDANNVGGAYTFKINTSGVITQNAGSTIRQGWGYAEYLGGVIRQLLSTLTISERGWSCA